MSAVEILKFASQWFPLILATVSVVIATISAVVALKTYRKNARTKEAEFISQFHHAFFVDGTYKKVRDILDDNKEASADKVERLVSSESADFTDFLNFFELAAYFESCGTLSVEAVEAVLGYYLNLLDQDRRLREYVKDPQKGFEYLDRFLSRRRTSRGRE